MRVSKHLLRAALLPMLPLLFTACAGLPEQPAISNDDVAWVRGGAGAPLDVAPDGMEDISALMRVTPEMSRFAHLATDSSSGYAAKTEALSDALDSDKGLHMRYDSEATLTAAEAFRQRRANCLSYTLLYVTLAREVGLPAQFNEVDVPPIWDLGDERTSVLYRHINARIDLPKPYYRIVDVSGDEYDRTFDQRVISDTAALAQFYNNRAVELRLQRHDAEALRYQLRALQLSPDAAFLWTNLAGLYLLDGNVRAARIAVTQSLKLDGASMMSYDAAAHVYEQLGDKPRARYFHDRVQAFLEENPYYHYQLALAAFRDGDNRVAYNEGRRAIVMYPKDARFFFLMAVVLDQMGDLRNSNESLQIALELAPDAAQQERYKSKFARLTKQG